MTVECAERKPDSRLVIISSLAKKLHHCLYAALSNTLAINEISDWPREVKLQAKLKQS